MVVGVVTGTASACFIVPAPQSIRHVVAPSLLFAALLGARSVLAEDEGRGEGDGAVTVRLEWRQEAGAESCLDGESLKRAVNQRWGRSVFADGARPDIVLRGTVAHAEPSRWTASLDLERADGTSLGSRQLVTTAPSCSSLDDSVALAVGLMLDVSRQRIVEERRIAAEQAPPRREPALDGPPIAIPKETLGPREPWRVDPSVGAEVAIGLLPGWSVAPRVGLAIVPPRFVRIEAAVAVFLPHEAGAGEGRGARFSAWTGELAVCPLSFATERLRADTCLTERVGIVRAAGFGFVASATAAEPLSAVGARETTTLTLAGPLRLFLGLGVEAPVVRYRFVFGDSAGNTRALYPMPAVMGSAASGLALEW